MATAAILKDAFDLHVHAGPDVIARRQDLVELARDAKQAGMAGLALKDHTTSTAGRCHALNRLFEGPPTFYGCVALNPPVGGLNPSAVESALREGARIVHFPTYGALNHIQRWGRGKPPTAFPIPADHAGSTIWDGSGGLRPEVDAILDLIARFDAVLATGHLSGQESLALLRRARERGVTRAMVNHVSESVATITLEQQREAASLGAVLEHAFFALTAACPGTVTIEEMRDQIRAVGVGSVVLTSDLGQLSNAPAVEGFAAHLESLLQAGMTRDELRVMTCDVPRRLVGPRQQDAT